MFQRLTMFGALSLIAVSVGACSSSGKVSIGDDGTALGSAVGVAPGPGATSGAGGDVPPGVSDSPDQPASCITFDGPRLVQVSLEDGSIAPMFDVHGEIGDVTSIALTAGSFLFCGGGSEKGGVRAVSLQGDGAITTVSNIPCDAVSADDEAIWVQSMSEQTLKRFPDVAALGANKPSAVLRAPMASRLGPGQGELLAAWHSDSKISRIDRATGAATEVPLEGFDGWIFGISAARGGRVVISSPIALGGEGTLISFDVKTGKRIKAVGKPSSPLGFQGLFCEYQGFAVRNP